MVVFIFGIAIGCIIESIATKIVKAETEKKPNCMCDRCR